MHVIDRHAYANRGRDVDPAQKGVLVLLVLSLCLLLDRPVVGFLACGWMWALATFWAGLPPGVFGRLLFGEAAFLLFAVLGVAVSVSLAPAPPLGWMVQVGPLAFGTSHASLDLALRLATRALGGVAALNFLILTTPFIDIVELLRRMRTPALLIDIVTLTYRFIFVLLESLDRMHNAQDSRLGYSSFRNSMASLGVLGSRLFIDAYHRSKRMQIALESRGSSGDLRVLSISYRTDQALWLLGLATIASLLIGRVLL